MPRSLFGRCLEFGEREYFDVTQEALVNRAAERQAEMEAEVAALEKKMSNATLAEACCLAVPPATPMLRRSLITSRW